MPVKWMQYVNCYLIFLLDTTARRFVSSWSSELLLVSCDQLWSVPEVRNRHRIWIRLPPNRQETDKARKLHPSLRLSRKAMFCALTRPGCCQYSAGSEPTLYGATKINFSCNFSMEISRASLPVSSLKYASYSAKYDTCAPFPRELIKARDCKTLTGNQHEWTNSMFSKNIVIKNWF